MEKNYDIISRINEHYPRMSKSQRVIAAYIEEHYDQAVFMTAAKMGQTLGISESTVVRFAASIGYDGYPELQKALEEWVKDKINSVQKMGVKYGGSTQSEILTSVMNADMEKYRIPFPTWIRQLLRQRLIRSLKLKIFISSGYVPVNRWRISCNFI